MAEACGTCRSGGGIFLEVVMAIVSGRSIAPPPIPLLGAETMVGSSEAIVEATAAGPRSSGEMCGKKT